MVVWKTHFIYCNIRTKNIIFKPNLTAVQLDFWKLNCHAFRFFEFHARRPLWKSSCCAFWFFKFYAGSFTENLIAVHLGFSNFLHDTIFENLTPMQIGLPNIMHGCRACRHSALGKVTITRLGWSRQIWVVWSKKISLSFMWRYERHVHLSLYMRYTKSARSRTLNQKWQFVW